MIKSATYAALTAFAATQAVAADISDCPEARANGVWHIAEPWEANSRSFANGEIRIAVLDTVEPANSAFYLAVLSPPYDLVGGRKCQVISYQDRFGFTRLSLGGMESQYDPASGLTFRVPAQVFDAQSAANTDRTLVATLDQSTGQLEAIVE